jgi:hypothetical protein
VVPPMPILEVFPRFGAMILGQPSEQPSYPLAAHLLGWTYHFSNGCTVGVMYLALVGDGLRRHWGWAVVMAVSLEQGCCSRRIRRPLVFTSRLASSS